MNSSKKSNKDVIIEEKGCKDLTDEVRKAIKEAILDVIKKRGKTLEELLREVQE